MLGPDTPGLTLALGVATVTRAPGIVAFLFTVVGALGLGLGVSYERNRRDA